MIFDFIILDKDHSIKNKDSIISKNILPIIIRAKRFIIMTIIMIGTPFLAKLNEGYSLLFAYRPYIFYFFK